jgi:hypothetical protein
MNFSVPEFGRTDFVGYDSTEADVRLLALVRDGTPVPAVRVWHADRAVTSWRPRPYAWRGRPSGPGVAG